MKYLITGSAGFIGNFVAERLCLEGHDVIGIDNLNNYYSVELKLSRLERLYKFKNFKFIKIDISDRERIAKLFSDENFDRVIHLAAQAGVRYSIENPMAYVDSNLTGMMTILEGCRHNNVGHLVYASSSSVYGNQQKIPFSENDSVDTPISLYAATKKSNELMAHTYSHLYSLPTTGLRFFTVYGPWGRPDMAPYKFTKAILENKPIEVYNNGNLQRDFTFIDDIVEGVIAIQNRPPNKTIENPQNKYSAFYQVFNIGNNKPVELRTFIDAIERATGKDATKILLPMQPGDTFKTIADTNQLESICNFRPNTDIYSGIEKFVAWYKSYHL